MVSVKEIAYRAGVSAATVSRVLHKSDKVRPDTRQAVEAIMRELNVTAVDLIRTGNAAKGKRNQRLIGVLVPDILNSFFIEIIQGIEAEAQEAGVSVLICHTRNSDREEISFLHLLQEARVCGVIITPASDDDDNVNNEYLNLLHTMHIPIVLVDRDVKYSNYGGVFIDNEKGAFEATRMLLKNGHERVAMIGGPMNTTPGRARLQGYRDAFTAAGLPVDESLIFYGDFSAESGERITGEILRGHLGVTALFSANNLMTLGCISALTKAGLRVPEDIALVGFDEIPVLEMLGIRLTTVKQPASQMGRQAMRLLSDVLQTNRHTEIRRVALLPELIIRGSEIRAGYESDPG